MVMVSQELFDGDVDDGSGAIEGAGDGDGSNGADDDLLDEEFEGATESSV